MDKIDLKILKCLSNNSRMNAIEIAKTVELSTSACIERIKKLELNGTIKKYTIMIEPESLGKQLTAFVSVRLDHPKFADEFIKSTTNNPNVIECHYVAGDYDYLLKIVTESTKTLEEVLQIIKSTNGVTRTNTTITLNTLKCEASVIGGNE